MNLDSTESLVTKERLILELFEIGAISFGEFKLKSGKISPFYIDLRLLVTYPYLLGVVADVFWTELRLMSFDLIVGVPYAAIPIATALSYKYNKPMVFVRKEVKSYGKKKLIEGVYHDNQTVVLIDDVISDGASKIETIRTLEDEKLEVSQVVVLLDRGQGGDEEIRKSGYKFTSILSIVEVLNVLAVEGRIDKKTLKNL